MVGYWLRSFFLRSYGLRQSRGRENGKEDEANIQQSLPNKVGQ